MFATAHPSIAFLAVARRRAAAAAARFESRHLEVSVICKIFKRLNSVAVRDK